MSSLAQFLCVFCISLSDPPHPQLSHQWAGIRYTHEILGRNVHLLRLSTEYLPFDSNSSAEQRMSEFASYFASTTCPRRFVFENHRSPLPPVRPTLAKNFVFHCR